VERSCSRLPPRPAPAGVQHLGSSVPARPTPRPPGLSVTAATAVGGGPIARCCLRRGARVRLCIGCAAGAADPHSIQGTHVHGCVHALRAMSKADDARVTAEALMLS
jgi:hypothetical protein